MHDIGRLLALPASLLIVLSATAINAEELKWPFNLPRNVKYYPEDEPHVKRGLEAQQKLTWQEPVGMKKLGDDPGEKFFLHYWDFGEYAATDETGDLSSRRLAHHNELGQCGNASRLLPPIGQHTNHDRHAVKLSGRSIFAREFECPAGTTSCSNIGSDLCCQSGETCVNTSEGVGCCPAGATCGDEVGECDTSAGYTSCPNDGAGCCIPGAACVADGCAFYGTATVTRTLPVATQTTGTINTSSQRPTTIIVSESGRTTTVTVTASGDDSTQTVTVTQPTTIVIGGGTASRSCKNGFQSCPATLGGGCCAADQVCGTSTSCLDRTTTTSATAAPPVRPTSSEESETGPTTTTTQAVEGCPTGFYMCSAVYLGGCCRVDRNCDTTSCPASASTNVVSNSGLTVAAGGGNAAATSGSCANGWATCGADVGGGCCPTGYQCASNCINTAPGGSNTTKQAPESAAPAVVRGFAWSLVFVGLASGVGMLWL
ncbi:hypothetical protein Slin15195_G119370 [Septoria linicola]|uniref:GPI anchored protein n=1 Tax=Septoria linicola TaxID=215465 RepID=A0A9Q9B721_9PEZI|nr:hypothetical protein Slin14017_G096360 [Septoria linicola]USW58618.1 hypothetical protein Slin15195_G119370 [Septoria linicola]